MFGECLVALPLLETDRVALQQPNRPHPSLGNHWPRRRAERWVWRSV